MLKLKFSVELTSRSIFFTIRCWEWMIIIFRKKKNSLKLLWLTIYDFHNDPIVMTVFSLNPYGLNKGDIFSPFWHGSSRWTVRADKYLDVPNLARRAAESYKYIFDYCRAHSPRPVTIFFTKKLSKNANMI